MRMTISARRLQFDGQIILFAVSALISAWIAYNTAFAWLRFTLITIGIAIYLLFANLTDRPDRRSVVRLSLAALPSIIAVWFVITNDWSRATNKLAVLDPVLKTLSLLRLLPNLPQINPNVIGGVIAMLLPLQIAALKGRRKSITVIWIGLSLIGLALSEARSAWLALLIVTGMWFTWRVTNQRIASRQTARLAWMTIVSAGGAIVMVGILATPIGLRLIDAGGDRLNIWRNSLDLVSDYPITGYGLGDFEMTYSTYALLVHVGHTEHAHNLWLNVWLEQGLLGLVALTSLVLNAIWPKPSSPWRMAALAALAVMLLHTLVDDPFYGYGVTIPMMFIPLGLLARSGEITTPQRRFRPAYVVWAAAALIVVAAVILPKGQAVIEGNLGALSQTRAELAVYRWPDVPLQDALRRPGGVDLSAAVSHYESALALNPFDASANRRLGQIELSQGSYDMACMHLATAYQAAPQQRATRQLLGECDALNGERQQAVQLWQSIDLSENQLDIRQWWYSDYLADYARAAKLKQAFNMLNNQSTPHGDGSVY